MRTITPSAINTTDRTRPFRIYFAFEGDPIATTLSIYSEPKMTMRNASPRRKTENNGKKMKIKKGDRQERRKGVLKKA